MLKIIAVIFTLALTVVSCGNQNKNDSEQPARNTPAQTPAPNTAQSQPSPTPAIAPVDNSLTQFTAKIQGSWKTDCLVLTKNTSRATVFKIENTAISLIVTDYTDARCGTQKTTARLVGDYSLKNAATIKTGGYTIAYKFNSRFLTIYDASTVLLSNFGMQCGYRDWTSGVEKQIVSNSSTCLANTEIELNLKALPTEPVFVQKDQTLYMYNNDAALTALYTAKKQ